MKASALILSLCTALLGLSGCSTPCERVCSEYNACDLEKRIADVDCATFCSRVEQFEQSASKAGADTCKSQFDAYISCWETNIKDICNAESMVCDASATAWTDCMGKFCGESHTEPPPADAGPDAEPTVIYHHTDEHGCVPPDPALEPF